MRPAVAEQYRSGEARATAQGLSRRRASSAFVPWGFRGRWPIGRVSASLKRGDLGRESDGRGFLLGGVFAIFLGDVEQALCWWWLSLLVL